MQGPLRGAQRSTQQVESRWILVVAVDVAEQRQELVEGSRIDSTSVGRQAVPRSCSQLIEVPARLCDSDHGDAQMAALRHRLQRRKDFLVREVSGGAEEHERIRRRWRHDLEPSFLTATKAPKWPERPR